MILGVGSIRDVRRDVLNYTGKVRGAQKGRRDEGRELPCPFRSLVIALWWMLNDMTFVLRQPTAQMVNAVDTSTPPTKMWWWALQQATPTNWQGFLWFRILSVQSPPLSLTVNNYFYVCWGCTKRFISPYCASQKADAGSKSASREGWPITTPTWKIKIVLYASAGICHFRK